MEKVIIATIITFKIQLTASLLTNESNIIHLISKYSMYLWFSSVFIFIFF